MIQASQEDIDQVMQLKLLRKKEIKASFLKKRRNCENIVEQYSERKKKIQLAPIIRPRFEDLICPICLEIFQKVTTTQCGHAFCEMCIFDSLIRKAECPVCRVKITTHNFQYCESFDSRIIQLVCEYGDASQIEHFKKREAEKQEWNEQKKLGNFEIGQKVDIMDHQFVWCVGSVKSISSKELFIHYDGWGNEYDEFIPLASHRIAPHGLYTNRTDIPKYNLDPRPIAELLQMIHSYENQVQQQPQGGESQ